MNQWKVVLTITDDCEPSPISADDLRVQILNADMPAGVDVEVTDIRLMDGLTIPRNGAKEK